MHDGKLLPVLGAWLLDGRNEDAHDDKPRRLADVDGGPRYMRWWLLIDAKVVGKEICIIHKTYDAQPDACDAVGIQMFLGLQLAGRREAVIPPAVRPGARERDGAERLRDG